MAIYSYAISVPGLGQHRGGRPCLSGTVACRDVSKWLQGGL